MSDRASEAPESAASAVSRVPAEIARLKIQCKDCTLFQLCLPVGVGAADLELLDRIIKRRRMLPRGEHLFRVGDPFNAIYAVRSGSIKTYTMVEDGRVQVTGFHLPGELLGLDAINVDRHPCSARTLEATSVCEVPFDRFEELSRQVPALARQMFRIMSKEILHDHDMLTQLGRQSSEHRLAGFLVNLSERYGARGFSRREYNLSMSRTDIGNYLGLAEETVSRLFTRFQEQGLLQVTRKHVRITDLERLHSLAGLGARGR
ncbi:fumarate/nitrate reduction transcriptional regulator Fnr [Sulfurifustis variabilis]|uniref:fumarate/nitrate reduction transcriptional regulator Fnr n=1 Tax=Sulfurifustis variabilis TaxID=1675686 RepID=UPI000BBA6B3C|nr:fumarate/nitrate reduction transcriptional regulator Fnr [Sulfurifustis variabilis]